MKFEERKELAIAELKSKNIWKIDYQPPLYTLLWTLGLKIRPPHYQRHILRFLVASLFYGFLVGLFDWIFFHDMSIPLSVDILQFTIFSGTAFGFFTTLFYYISVKRKRLTKWEHLA
jgi:hypothetical protein